jgi:membrane protein
VDAWKVVKQTFALFQQTWTEFNKDNAPRLGAALAYYTLFSIVPLFLIAIRIASVFFDDAQQKVAQQLRPVMGPSVADALTEMLTNANKHNGGGTLATILGAVMLIFGAAAVFGHLKDAFNTIWNVETKPAGGIVRFVKQRFLSIAMVMGVGLLLLVSVMFDAALAALEARVIARVTETVTSFVLLTLLLAMMFRFLPDTRIEWRDVWLGAAFTSFLFVIGEVALGLYLGRGAVGSAYGAAGSLVILLVWVYWSAQILFFGAEFTQVYARLHGSRARLAH